MDARCGQTGKSLNDACTLVGLHACMHVRSRKHSACMHACVCMDDMNVCTYVRKYVCTYAGVHTYMYYVYELYPYM